MAAAGRRAPAGGVGPETTRWVLSRRGGRNPLDPARPYAWLLERERAADGVSVEVATLFLTNAECPYRCVMCDLWRNTLAGPTPRGAIPRQIDFALDQLAPTWQGPRRQIKLYNAGSFFDSRAIPPADHPAVIERVRGFERVIVESHPALVGPRILPFRDGLDGRLEVALGLETAHAPTLSRLNKGMTVASFQRAAAFLRLNDIALRVFLLVHPPFVPPAEAHYWLRRSLQVAFDAGATACSLIPLRLGNGALDDLARRGLASEPPLLELARVLGAGVRLGRGRVFADLWDLDRFAACRTCRPEIVRRLIWMNDRQARAPQVRCRHGRGSME